jgi:putative PEP-CTERM system histidine kinase
MISDIGYGLNAAGYFLLFLLILTSRQTGVAKRLLILATVGTALWSLSFVSALGGEITVINLYFSDTLKQFVWLLFLAACLKSQFQSVWGVLKRPETLAILIVPTVVLVIPFFIVLQGAWLSLLQTVLALEVLVLLELVYRQAGKEQWAFKPLILFLGASQLYEFVLYANAIMVNEIDARFLSARGYVYLILIPLLVLAVRRIQNWGINIFVSRDVVLHSSLLLVAGIYLFLMALAGYAVSYLGGKWSTTIQVVMFSGSSILLVTLFLSNQFRTKIKIFITKHFFANQYDYRVEWVKLTKLLSESTKDIHEVHQYALTACMSSIQYDQGMLIKVNGAQLETLSTINASPMSEQRVKTLRRLLAYCEETHWLLDLDQFKVRPFDYPGLELSKDDVSLFRFQLVVPVFAQDKMWGVVLMNAVDSEVVTLDWELRDYLTAVTDQVSTYISHHESAKTLAENAQFAAFNRMSSFVVHDLKNVLAQVDLILANAEQHKHNPEFIDDTFETLEHTKARMDKMLLQLTDKKQEQKSDRSSVILSEVVQHIIDTRCRGLAPLPSVHVNSEMPLDLEKDKVTNVINHLLSNAQQATDDSGSIVVELDLHTESNTLNVSITDTGEGMSEDFVQQRLFKPFDTTKGNAGMGIGVYDAKNYMDGIGGHLDVKSQVGEGTTFTLVFPVLEKEQ